MSAHSDLDWLFDLDEPTTEEIPKGRLDPGKIVMVKAKDLKEGDLLVYYKKDFQGPQFTSPVTSIIHRPPWVYVTTKEDEKLKNFGGGWQPESDPVEVYKE